MPNKILVPLDGSELAAQVLPYASALAKATKAELLLLSAVVPIETWLQAAGVSEFDRWLDEETNAAMAYLKIASDALEQQGLIVRTKVLYGKAAKSIMRTADEERVDVIAMTTHGRSGLPRLVLGSVASEVVRTATQPVLLVRAAVEQRPADVRIERILIPVDGSALSESVIPLIEDLAGKLDAELILQRVITPPAVLYRGEVVPWALAALDDIEVATKEYVDGLAAKLRDRGFTVSREVSVGNAAESILAVAAQYRADMIAMSSHGRTGFGRWVMGSVADEVVRRAPTPCLVIRPAAVADERLHDGPSHVAEVAAGFDAAKIRTK